MYFKIIEQYQFVLFISYGLGNFPNSNPDFIKLIELIGQLQKTALVITQCQKGTIQLKYKTSI